MTNYKLTLAGAKASDWNKSRAKCQQGSKQLKNPHIRERLWCLKMVRMNI